MLTDAENPENSNIFTVMERGDRRIRQAYRKAIILVGNSRIGKSTTFNWILKKPMKGKGGKLNSQYINIVQNDESAAKIGNSYSSVTLDPNVHIDYQENVSLIDMAGYKDTRNYVGVIGVSYFLKALFQQVREVKFIIVFDQQMFFSTNGQGLIKTFNGFLNMFHYNDMPADIKQKLKNSISVVVSKSKIPQQHFSYMDEVRNQFSDLNLNVQNREAIIDLMDSIRNSARIHPFLAAKDSGNPEQCTFIQNFTNNYQWKYFNLDEAEEKMGKSPISLPFEKDFQSLPEPQIALFTNVINQRVMSYIGFSSILKTVISNFNTNWTQFLHIWRTQGKAIPNHFRLKPSFDSIREYVEANDVYNSKQAIETKFRVNYDPMTLIKSINQLLSIYDHFTAMGTSDNLQQFDQAMAKFDCKFSALIQCLRGFASDSADEELLQRLKYILRRGFREFTKLYQLRKECIHDVKQKLRDDCNIVFDITKQKLIQRFATQFTSDLLVKLFPNIELLNEYEQFFRIYQRDFRYYQSQIFFSQRRCYIEMAKADLLLSLGQKPKALKCYVKALRSISDICIGLLNQEAQGQDKVIKQNQLNKLSMNKIKLIRKIVKILKALPDSDRVNYKKYALWLCQHHKMIEDTCQIYQDIVDSPSTNTLEKLKIYADYAEFCAKWGKIECGITLLQKKLSLQQQNFDDYISTFTAMNLMISGREEYMRNFINAVNEVTRLPEVDGKLIQQLQQIDTLVIQ